MEAQINSVLVGLFAQVAGKWFLTGVGTKMALEMVRLGVPATANGTLKRFFARVGANMDNQTFLVRKRFAARGTDVWSVAAVGPAVLRQHSFGQEVGTTLTDERTIAGM